MYKSKLFILFTLCFSLYFCDEEVEESSGPIFQNVTVIVTTLPTNDTSATTHSPNKEILHIESDNKLAPYLEKFQNTPIEVTLHGIIPGIKLKPFENVKDIKVFISKNNRMKFIHPHTFDTLEYLEKIDVSGNIIEIIEDNVFTGLKIKELDLSNNEIHTIKDSAFRNMPNLNYLMLSRNKLIKFDRDWCLNTPVSYLSLSLNQIEHLDPNNFNFLKPSEKYRGITIGLNDNKIKRIDEGTFFGLPRVDLLHLESNQITEIEPGAFDNIEHVYLLKLLTNNLTKFDENVLEDTTVELVDIRNNQLEEFPLGLLEDGKVKELLIDFNPVKCSWLKQVKYGIKDKQYWLNKNCKK